MTERVKYIKAVLTTPIPKKPEFETFLASLKAAELSVKAEGNILTVEITRQHIEGVRELVEALLGRDKCSISILEFDVIKNLEIPITELNLNERTKFLLTENEILTVRDLLKYSSRELGKVRSGKIRHGYLKGKELREIYAALYKRGLHVGMFNSSSKNSKRIDLSSNEVPFDWQPITEIAKMMPGKLNNGVFLRSALEPLIEKIPDQIDWFKLGTRSILYCHPKLFNRIIATCKTKEDLDIFVRTTTAK